MKNIKNKGKKMKEKMMKEELILNGKELRKIYQFLKKTRAAQIELIWELEKDIGIWVYKRSENIIEAIKNEEKDIQEGSYNVCLLEEYIEEHPGELNLKGTTEDELWDEVMNLTLEENQKIAKLLKKEYPLQHQGGSIKQVIKNNQEITINSNKSYYKEIKVLKEACFNHLLIKHNDGDEVTRLFPIRRYNGKTNLQINSFCKDEYSAVQLFNKKNVEKIINYLINIKEILN